MAERGKRMTRRVVTKDAEVKAPIEVETPIVVEDKPIPIKKSASTAKVKFNRNVKNMVDGGYFFKGEEHELSFERASAVVKNGWGTFIK